LHGFYLVGRSFAGNEVKVQKLRLIASLFEDIHHERKGLKVGPFADEADATAFEDEQVVVVVEVLNSLLWVADPHLYFLGHVVEGLADEALEEMDVLEYLLVRLL
jgi:hypothetical protein